MTGAELGVTVGIVFAVCIVAGLVLDAKRGKSAAFEWEAGEKPTLEIEIGLASERGYASKGAAEIRFYDSNVVIGSSFLLLNLGYEDIVEIRLIDRFIFSGVKVVYVAGGRESSVLLWTNRSAICKEYLEAGKRRAQEEN